MRRPSCTGASRAYADPLEFVRNDPAYQTLDRGYAEDMQHARDLRPVAAREHAAVYVLPDASWARRVSGALANGLARAAPARAHAMLSPNNAGGMQVSVRAPLERPAGAAALCLEYATGGGREAAAGINHLPDGQRRRFHRALPQALRQELGQRLVERSTR